MNPLLGRWISADPLAVHAPGEADLNVYAYVSGSILKNVDPLGLQAADADDDAAEDSSGNGDAPGNETAQSEVAEDETGAYGTGGASANAPDVEDAGTGHRGAPSDGAAEQGGIDETSPKVMAAVGEMANFLNPLAATGDTPCQGSDCDGRQAQAVVGDLAMGGLWGAVKAGRALSPAARENLLGEMDRMGDDIARKLDDAPAIEVRTPTVEEGVDVADALAHELRASEAAKTGGGRNRAAAVVGRYDDVAQEAEAFASRPGRHAEGVAKDAMPNGHFSKPLDVKKGTPKNVCKNCQGEHGRDPFPEDTGFD